MSSCRSLPARAAFMKASFFSKHGSLWIKCQRIAEIIPDTPVPAIMLRTKVRWADCKMVSNDWSQTTDGQTIVADRMEEVQVRRREFRGQSSEDRRTKRSDKKDMVYVTKASQGYENLKIVCGLVSYLQTTCTKKNREFAYNYAEVG